MDQRKALYQTQPILRKAVDEIPHQLILTSYCPDGIFMKTNAERDISFIATLDVTIQKARQIKAAAVPHSIWFILLQVAYRFPELTIIKRADDRFDLVKPTNYIGGIDPYQAQSQVYEMLVTGKTSVHIPAINEISFFDLFLICKRNLEKNGST